MSLRGVACGAIVALLTGSACAFGAVEAWAESWLLVGALAAFVLAFWGEPPTAARIRTARAVALPILLLVVWAMAQSLPLPGGLGGLVGAPPGQDRRNLLPEDGGIGMPRRLVALSEKRGFRIEPGGEIPAGVSDPGSAAARTGVSSNPHATRRAAASWLTALLLFLAAADLARDRLLRYRLLWGVAGATGLLALLAVAGAVAGNGKLLWMRTPPPGSTPVGPFVNPNHFAGWIEMGWLVAVGLALAMVGGANRRVTIAGIRAALLDRSWSLPRLLALVVVVILGGGGLLLAGSRGGALALALGGVVLVPWFRARAWLPTAATLLLVAGMVAGPLSALGGDEDGLREVSFSSAGSDPSLAMRVDIWKRTWRILRDHPWTGTGLGTFRWAYAGYDREGEWMTTAQAHDDYLQLASETGLIGVLLAGWCALSFSRKVLRRALRPGTDRPAWTTVALAAAILAMLAHSLIEFNLQIPAVAGLFAVLAGALTAAADDGNGEPAGEGA